LSSLISNNLSTPKKTQYLNSLQAWSFYQTLLHTPHQQSKRQAKDEETLLHQISGAGNPLLLFFFPIPSKEAQISPGPVDQALQPAQKLQLPPQARGKSGHEPDLTWSHGPSELSISRLTAHHVFAGDIPNEKIRKIPPSSQLC
jgi:hypothetical protein